MASEDKLTEEMSDEEAKSITRASLKRLERQYKRKRTHEVVLTAVILAAGSDIPIPAWAATAQAQLNREVLAIRDAKGRKQDAKAKAVVASLEAKKKEKEQILL